MSGMMMAQCSIHNPMASEKFDAGSAFSKVGRLVSTSDTPEPAGLANHSIIPTRSSDQGPPIQPGLVVVRWSTGKPLRDELWLGV
jgi:hypothetical protein